MPSFDRNRLMLDLFGSGLPDGLATPLELEVPPWMFLSTPIEMLTAEPSEDLPDTLDLIGGRLMPRRGADLSACERSARFHFWRSGQEVQRQKLMTELALSRGLLVPDLVSLFVVQFLLPCEHREADQLARSLMDIGFARVVVIVGTDSTAASNAEDDYVVVRSHVQDEGGTLRLVVDGDPKGVMPLRNRTTSERLQSRLAHLIETMNVPKRPPIVIDMGTHDGDG